MENIEALKDKIAKLLAKAEGTNNAAEADAFLAKAMELLEKYQIDIHEIRSRTGRESDPYGHEKGTANLYTSAVWYRGVAVALARYYGCEFIYNKKNMNIIYTLVGRQSSRTTTELMLPFVLSQVTIVARKYMKEQLAVGHKIHERAATAHIGAALEQRIWKLILANREHRRDLESRALVPVDPEKEYIAKTWGRLGTGTSTYRNTTSDARRHAEDISLNVQATHDKKRMVR